MNGWEGLRTILEKGMRGMGFSFCSSIGIDLGTANTLVYMKGKGIILREPSVVAVEAATGQPRFFGSEAKAVIGRTPESILAVRPLRQGVIADFDVTAAMLEHFIKKACGKSLFFRPWVVICVPGGVTEVERRAVQSAARRAGAGQVDILEEPMAAAIGAGLPIEEPAGNLIVDIGGGTTEVAVISLGGVVASRSLRVGGDAFDKAIAGYIKQKHNLLVGERTAEGVKIALGGAGPVEEELTMEVKGRNLVDGLPKNVTLRTREVREALADSVSEIVEAVKSALEVTPPELSSDIVDRGITLSGGGSLLPGLDQVLAGEIGIPVKTVENPLDCVVLGAGAMLDRPRLLRQILDSNPRSYD